MSFYNPRGRGSGRGRGGNLSYIPSRTSNTWVAPGLAQKPGNKVLVVNNNNATISSAAAAAAAPAAAFTSSVPTTVPSQHKKLVKIASSSVSADSKVASVGVASTSQAVQPVASTSRDIDIGGVLFVSDPSGKKLVRKAVSGSGALSSTPVPPQSTPNKVSYAGQDYVRTKSGNLIAKKLVAKHENQAKQRRLNPIKTIRNGHNSRSNRNFKKRSSRRQPPPPPPAPRPRLELKNTLCRYFTKTGECRNALTCPYIHDSNKVSICSRFVRGNCDATADTCPLSHIPDPHRMPHCVHYPSCKNGDTCMFPHVHLNPSAPVCRDFAVLGWCERGLDCPAKHVNECPEFSETGRCLVKGCKLPHVIRRRKPAPAELQSISQPPSALSLDSQQQKNGLSMAESIRQSIHSAQASINSKKRKIDEIEANTEFITFVASDDEIEEGEIREGDDEEESEEESGSEEEEESEEKEDRSVDSDSMLSPQHLAQQDVDMPDVESEAELSSTDDDFDPDSLLLHR